MHGMYAGNERRNRVVALVLAVVLVAGVVLALLATVVQARPAQAAVPAHASLVSVTPADGTQLTSVPSEIRLTFDSVVIAQFVQTNLTRDGAQVETGPPSSAGTVVTVPVTGRTGPGAYRLLWQVTGEDGHRISGESGFSVVAGAAGGAVATPAVTPTYKTPQTQPTTIGHPDHLPGLITAGILLLGGLVLLVYEHRRRARANDAHDADVQDRQRIS
jgi:methionine-rich copper-binding protein CopC